MIVQQTYHIQLLFKRLLIILGIFSICRLLFYLFNLSAFSESSGSDILLSFVYGLRFDVSAILYCNILFIFLHAIPHPYRPSVGYQRITKGVFYLFNVPALLFSLVDVEYFKFTKKRSTFDIFGMRSDWAQSLPQYLKDFWYLVLALILFIIAIEIFYRKTQKRPERGTVNYPAQTVLFVLSAIVFIVGARGGWQLKPLKISDAALSVYPQAVPLVLNTPFTIIRTYGRKSLSEVHYMPDSEARKIIPLRHQTDYPGEFQKKNVVIIIVESLSREFMGRLNSFPGFTPFLDSLSNHSLLCTNAFANGTRSMEALPAILASIPNLMDDSYMFSVYQANQINSIGSVLRKEGYSTAFFHGGTNGTMGFDSFIKIAGFDEYYGRAEYNNENDYDGMWGIYDEEFLQYVARVLDDKGGPFCAAIFTLSSHHPYTVPQRYANDFHVGTLPIHRAIRYTDYSLQRFFSTASKMPWYRNTIFIITGDHTPAEAQHPVYQTRVGLYSLPIIVFDPDGSLQRVDPRVIQHVDIMPTILDYLQYDKPYVAFGTSILDTAHTRYSINFLNDVYQLVGDSYILQFSDEAHRQLYDYRADTLLTLNIINEQPGVKSVMTHYLEAFIQLHNHALIRNEMVIERLHGN
jgi:phosphoglycerol transferase MdoB-like AlkP superfamily enzyme